jgi:hypothetical protein
MTDQPEFVTVGGFVKERQGMDWCWEQARRWFGHWPADAFRPLAEQRSPGKQVDAVVCRSGGLEFFIIPLREADGRRGIGIFSKKQNRPVRDGQHRVE